MLSEGAPNSDVPHRVTSVMRAYAPIFMEASLENTVGRVVTHVEIVIQSSDLVPCYCVRAKETQLGTHVANAKNYPCHLVQKQVTSA